jgi:hypothetical protein
VGQSPVRDVDGSWAVQKKKGLPQFAAGPFMSLRF